MKALTFEVTAIEPLLMARVEGDPNSAVSFPYIPGSVIRGALIDRYRPRAPEDLAGDDTCRRLFFEGTTCYLNAYPLRNGARALPTPLALFQEKKADGNQVLDFSVRINDDVNQPVNLKDELCWLAGGQITPYEDRDYRHIAVHTARERVKGRATEDEGAVFRYQAIAPGARFQGVILAAEADAPILKELLASDEVWLGKSRTGGYGRVAIDNVQEPPTWSETRTIPGHLGPGSTLIITLLSHLIIRTADGAYAENLSPNLLPAPFDTSVALRTGYKHITPLGGFNRTWGLPINQVPALSAGSVFVYNVASEIKAADIEKLEAHGLGERRAEGLGRVAVNWTQQAELILVESDSVLPVEPLPLSNDGRAVIQHMLQRLLRHDLDTALAESAQKTNVINPPRKSQLSRLRVIALNALPSRDLDRLLAFLSDEQLKAKARDQYREARLAGDNQRLIEWLAEVLLNALTDERVQWLLDETHRDAVPPLYRKGSINGLSIADRLRARAQHPKDIWQRLMFNAARRQIGDEQANLTDDLAQAYSIRLIADVLHRATKEANHD